MNDTHKIDKKKLIPVMIGIMLSLLLAALDNTIVGTAMAQDNFRSSWAGTL